MSIKSGLVAALAVAAIASAAHAQKIAAPGEVLGPDRPVGQGPPPPGTERTPLVNTSPPGTLPMFYDTSPTIRFALSDILAHDAEKSAKFYQDVLGMKIFRRRVNNAFTAIYLAFPTPDGKMLANPPLRIMQDEKYADNQTLSHFTVAAPAAEFPNIVARAKASGFPALRSSPTLIYLADPSGNIVEISPINPNPDPPYVTKMPGN